MQSVHFQQNVPADKKMRPLLQQVNTVHSSMLEGFFSYHIVPGMALWWAINFEGLYWYHIQPI